MGSACGWPELTVRERQVLARTLCGQVSKHIGSEMGIAVSTVIFHRANIRAKFRTVTVGAVLAQLEQTTTNHNPGGE